jgi:hypothetical protein
LGVTAPEKGDNDDKKMRPDDLDDEMCDDEGAYWPHDWQWMGNYTLAAIDAATEVKPD